MPVYALIVLVLGHASKEGCHITIDIGLMGVCGWLVIGKSRWEVHQ